mgnify:CR=1 FL=1
MQVVAILGSPRKGGNTETLVEAALRGVRAAGGEAQVFRVHDLDIRPCLGCGYCEREGKCKINDDMSRVNELLARAEGLIFSSPVYFAGVSSPAKALIDRCQVYWARKNVLELEAFENEILIGRRGIFIATAGSRDHGGALFDPAIETVKLFFKAVDYTYSEEILVDNTDRKAVQERPELLEKAYAAGARLIL